MSRFTTWTATAAFAIAGAFLIQDAAMADTIPFGETQTFESASPGTQPDGWHDSDSGYVGRIEVVSSGTDGVFAGPAGGSQFAKVVAGPDDSYSSGYRNGPYGHIGTQASFPGSGNRYATFIDIYAQSTTSSSGALSWDSVISKASGGYGTEQRLVITPGATTWNFTPAGLGVNGITLPVGAWYTLETIWSRSKDYVTATVNIYAQGQRDSGSPLASYDLYSFSTNLPSSEVGGPGIFWFTVWDNRAVDAIYIDNAGTAVVPLPAALPAGLAMLGGMGVVRLRRRRRRSTEM